MKTSLGSNKLLKASNKLESKLPIHSKSPVDYGKIQIQKQKPGSNAKE